MKSLIIYDSLYGNTEKIAKTIGSSLSADIKHVSKIKLSEISTVKLLIIGSPTHGGRPTPAIQEFLTKIPANVLKGVHVTAFDTRFAPEDHGIGLRILMNVIRFAAERIVKSLKTKGGILIHKPEGFIVKDKEGPLEKGELERAANWAKEILKLSKRKKT